MRPMDSLPGWPRDPLRRLFDLADARDQLQIMIEHAVAEARDSGKTWQQIADALGVSKQYAWERYHGEDR